MPIEKHLDYIQASCLIPESAMRASYIQKTNSIAHYSRGYKDETGTRYYFGNPNSKKCLLVLSGVACDEKRNSGYSDSEIVQSIIEKEGNFTRIDHACTVYNSENNFALSELQEAYSQGKIESPLCARGGTIVSKLELDGQSYPETFYIGDLKKRGKKGIFRAYDKGAQLEITRQILMRLELEERGTNAHQSAMRIAEGASVGAIFKARFNIDTPKFQAIFDEPSVKIQRGKSKKEEEEMSEDEKRWKWLIEQVAPTLKKAIELERLPIGSSKNLTRFIAAAGLRRELLNAAEWLAEQKGIE